MTTWSFLESVELKQAGCDKLRDLRGGLRSVCFRSVILFWSKISEFLICFFPAFFFFSIIILFSKGNSTSVALVWNFSNYSFRSKAYFSQAFLWLFTHTLYCCSHVSEWIPHYNHYDCLFNGCEGLLIIKEFECRCGDGVQHCVLFFFLMHDFLCTLLYIQ